MELGCNGGIREGCSVQAKKFINTGACNIQKNPATTYSIIKTIIYYVMYISATGPLTELVNLCICNWCRFTVDVIAGSK